MSLSLDRLKSAYREYLHGLNPRMRNACPDTPGLKRFFAPESPRRVKIGIIDHVGSCRPCAVEFEALMEKDRVLRNASVDTGRLSDSANREYPRWRRIATVAAGLAILAVGIWLVSGNPIAPSGEENILRALGTEAAMRLESPAGAISSDSRVVFRWNSSDGTDLEQYIVTLFDDTLRRVWESPARTENAVLLPPEIQRSLQADRRYYWGISRVSGEPGEESDLVEFWMEAVRGKANSSARPVRK